MRDGLHGPGRALVGFVVLAMLLLPSCSPQNASARRTPRESMCFSNGPKTVPASASMKSTARVDVNGDGERDRFLVYAAPESSRAVSPHHPIHLRVETTHGAIDRVARSWEYARVIGATDLNG